jgi:hypothetical protein
VEILTGLASTDGDVWRQVNGHLQKRAQNRLEARGHRLPVGGVSKLALRCVSEDADDHIAGILKTALFNLEASSSTGTSASLVCHLLESHIHDISYLRVKYGPVGTKIRPFDALLTIGYAILHSKSKLASDVLRRFGGSGTLEQCMISMIYPMHVRMRDKVYKSRGRVGSIKEDSHELRELNKKKGGFYDLRDFIRVFEDPSERMGIDEETPYSDVGDETDSSE